ncbi:hypothetical protein [Halorussus caseinilyticus]|uniref:Uncharacterized protein n=1 Tax=Halorussus caseinilyticus TaxID=3034025 RepID=A0ABD5WJ28_9EURY
MTARILRTEDGQTCTEYEVGGVAVNAYAGVRLPERALRVATGRHGIDRQPTNDTKL